IMTLMTSLFNSSQEIVFVLHGLNVTQANRHIYFVFIFILYLLTIVINLILIFTIALEKRLHDPMYLFLCSLCVNGIIGASSFYPKILYDILFDSHVITYIGCMTQIFFIFSYIYCECTNLTIMAYDRYVAICKPLHYHSIMTTNNMWTLIFLTWLFSWLECGIGMGLLVRLPLCNINIDKLYCSDWALVKLSCIDTTLNNIYTFIQMSFHVSQFTFIVISYLNIIPSLRSREDRRKFMQTCLPHIITLTNFLMSHLFDVMYARYGSNTSLLALRNIMSVEIIATLGKFGQKKTMKIIKHIL
uniref:G-protein coupled receptors family 1 profile domain-containing protein n=1 Tax=Esox lucius TaxID=8010 RepID=A0A6Q2ZCR1_ESOLU